MQEKLKMEIGRNKFEFKNRCTKFLNGMNLEEWINERQESVQLLEMGQAAMASSVGNLEEICLEN